MCRQAVHLSVHNFGFWLLKPPDRDEYPPGGASVLRFLLTCVLCRVIETSDYDFMY